MDTKTNSTMKLREAVSTVEYIARCLRDHGEYAPHFAGGALEDLSFIVEAVNSRASLLAELTKVEDALLRRDVRIAALEGALAATVAALDKVPPQGQPLDSIIGSATEPARALLAKGAA